MGVCLGCRPIYSKLGFLAVGRGKGSVARMLKIRAISLSVLALVVVSAMTTSTALAGPVFHVGGKRLGQETRQIKLQIKGVATLSAKVAGTEIAISCRNSVSEGSTIEGPNQGKGRLTFTSCKVDKPIELCAVAEPITTVQTKAHLAIDPNNKQQKFVEFFEPQQGTTFAILMFKGTGCGVILGNQAVKGSIAAEVVPIEREVQEGLLNFPLKPITEVELGLTQGQKTKAGLTFANEPAVFAAAFGSRLDNGEQGGVFGQ